MSPEFTQMLPYILIGLLVGFVVVWLMARANRKTTIIGDESSKQDVLDEGAAPAARNQALIDAPTSVENTIGQTSANANSDQIAAAPLGTDAEAGPPIEPSRPASGDDLRKIKGLGPKLVKILDEQGINSFAQIAAWTDDDVARIDASLGKFAGRITRDQWVEQAKLLESGDESGFDARFGKNT